MITFTDLAERALRVAESCRTQEQAEVAMRYNLRAQNLVDKATRMAADIPGALARRECDDLFQAEAVLASARIHLVDALGAPEVRRTTAHTYFQTFRHKRRNSPTG
jgi:hypothetical protein